jgi:hypothetical protein
MTIEEVKKIDFARINKKSNTVILTITDHLPWKNNDLDHLYLIQENINTCLSFVESGEMYEEYPKYKNKKVEIEIISKYQFNNETINFLEKVKDVVEGAGFRFNYKVSEK